MFKIGTRFFFCFALLMVCAFSIKADFSFSNTKSLPFNNQPAFVPAAQAFLFNFSQKENEIHLSWEIKPGYYLYQDKISVSSDNPDVLLGSFKMPKAIPYHDEFFGNVSIYKNTLTLAVPLLKASDNASLNVHYQGCAEAGFCYPPEKIVVPLKTVLAQSASETTPEQASKNEQATLAATEVISQQNVVTSIFDNWWQPLLFFGLGIGLAFTPCVLPMYPILTSIVLGGGKKSQGQALRLSMLYVQGMALTYTLLGLVVASAGLQFQAAFQHPYVLIGLSALFVLLSASMFGLFTLQLPSSLQTKLSQIGNQQEGGNLRVFTMGAISGLVCSPCTTAPLSGALLYVAQSGDLLTGAVTLYALALGMGIPLIAVALFGNKLLPKAGAWMDNVKVFFGFILLVAPIFLLERLLPENITIWLWGIWGFSVLCWIYHISSTIKPGKFASVLGVLAIVGLSFGASYIYNFMFSTETKIEQSQVDFIRIHSVEDLNRELAAAKLAKKPVLLDFYADWCVACKEFEKYTFHNPEVAIELKKFVLLQADVTDNSPQDIALLQSLHVLGLPTLDFWDANGDLQPHARLTGFVKAQPFLNHINQHQLLNKTL